MITIATLHNASLQQIFDQVAVHLLTQNRQAMHSNGELDKTCAYKNDGLMCAVGCLISDEEYSSSIEGRSFCTLIGLGFVPGNLEKNKIELITNLQVTHDEFEPHQWLKRLYLIASEFELSTDKIEKF